MVSLKPFFARNQRRFNKARNAITDVLPTNTKQKKKRHGKSVSFDLTKNVHHLDTHINEDCNDRWYSTKEYKLFKDRNRIEASEITVKGLKRRNKRGLSTDLLDYSFQEIMEITYDSCYCHFAIMGDNSSCYDSCCDVDFSVSLEPRTVEVLPFLEFQALLRTLEDHANSYGIERYSLPRISQGRSRKVQSLCEAIFQIQYQFEDEHSWCNDQQRQQTMMESERSCVKNYEMEERIRASCEEITRVDRLFARTMGHALSAAEGNEINATGTISFHK